MADGRVLLGGQADPAFRERLLVVGPGSILALGVALSVIPVAGNLFSGHFAAAVGALVAPAFFGGLFARFLYDFYPRRGWLEGSVLTVEGERGARRCDLASAAVVWLRGSMPPMAWGYGPIPVLFVRQDPGGSPVRLLLRGPDLRPFPAAQLRLLADVIGQRPGPSDRKAGKAVRRLRALAEEQEAPQGIVADWSHRTNPGGRGRSAEQEPRSSSGGGPGDDRRPG